MNDRVTPLPRRLKRCMDSVTRSSRVALVAEKRIRCEGKVPVTPDPAQLVQLIIFKAQVPLDVFIESLGGPAVAIREQNMGAFPVFAISADQTRLALELGSVQGRDDADAAGVQTLERQHFGKRPIQVPMYLRGAIRRRRNRLQVILELHPSVVEPDQGILRTAPHAVVVG